MNLWLTVIAAGALTFLIRLSFISLLADWDMPPILRQALHFVPPAVLSAIVFPELLLRNGELAFSADNYRLIAGIVAIAVAWKVKKIMPTIAVGMAVLWFLQAIP
jgi:branched-subunit amino acid transport protein